MLVKVGVLGIEGAHTNVKAEPRAGAAGCAGRGERSRNEAEVR